MSHRRSFGGIRRLPSKRYQAYYTGPDLNRHTAPVTFTSKIDAEAWLAAERRLTEDPATWQSPKVRLEAERARREAEQARTFGVYAHRWLRERDLSALTRATYEQLLRRLILPEFESVPLSQITREHVKTWLAGLATGSAYQRKHAYDLMRAIMNTAVDDELLDVNPVRVRGAGSVKRQTKTEPASLDELEVLTAATPERYRLMVLLAAWCGLRRGELRELRRGDVDTKQGVLRVRRSVGWVTGEAAIVKDPKTRAGVRDVAIPSHLLPLARQHLLQHAQSGVDGLLFPAPGGGQLRDGGVNRWFHPAREAAGRADLRFHDLRHTGATLAAQSGATLAELMHRLGHSTPAAAMRYQHAAAERDRQIADRLSVMAREHAQGGA